MYREIFDRNAVPRPHRHQQQRKEEDEMGRDSSADNTQPRTPQSLEREATENKDSRTPICARFGHGVCGLVGLLLCTLRCR